MSATRRPKDLPPVPPRKKKGDPPSRGRWNDVLIVHDDIRFGVTNFRSIEPDNETPEAPRTTTTSRRTR